MRTSKASSWTRKVSEVPTQASGDLGKRRARRYTVSADGTRTYTVGGSDQARTRTVRRGGDTAQYAQTQGTASRGPIAAALHHYVDADGGVWACWNVGEWEYCGQAAPRERGR